MRFLISTMLLIAACALLGCHSGKVSASGKTPELATIHLEDFIVNLADRDGRTYLRIGMDLGVEGEVPKAKSDQHAAMLPLIRDSVIALLSAEKAEDVLTADGKTKLKQDLIRTLNDHVPELKVRKIYFNDFMVQR